MIAKRDFELGVLHFDIKVSWFLLLYQDYVNYAQMHGYLNEDSLSAESYIIYIPTLVKFNYSLHEQIKIYHNYPSLYVLALFKCIF